MSSERTDTETAGAVVRRFISEVVNGGRHELIDELWATGMAWRGGSLGEIHGIDAYKDFMAANATGAFTGMRLVIQDVITENDKVVVWDFTWTTGVPTAMHFHDKDVVVVYLENGALKSTTPDRQSVVNELTPGLIRFNARERVHTEELVRGKSRAIITELK